MDLISRQAVIDVLAAMQGRCTSKAALIQNSKIWQQVKDLPSAQIELSDEEKRLIKQLRSYHNGSYARVIDKLIVSAQPMRKKGKWRWSEDMMCFICSECESGWKEQPTLMGKPLYEWCPVCGAEMREDDHEIS